jgi:hypothetical protein
MDHASVNTPSTIDGGGGRLNASNLYDSREAWLRAATDQLRSDFKADGYTVPSNIRFAIAFPSTGRKGNRVGECWASSMSADNHFEIIIRADQSEPVEVLGILVHELVHAVLPIDAGHGKLFREVALKIGLEGKMIHAMPGLQLRNRLTELADNLGPLPHARLKIERGPADRPKKQGTRMLKAECELCGYTVRIASKWVKEVGPPACPAHGAMTVDPAKDEPDRLNAVLFPSAAGTGEPREEEDETAPGSAGASQPAAAHEDAFGDNER